jgi:hypothetical protein
MGAVPGCGRTGVTNSALAFGTDGYVPLWCSRAGAVFRYVVKAPSRRFKVGCRFQGGTVSQT